jgi:arylsulfatase A-like enzyme
MAQANASQQPNILILWGDDVGWWNISYNSRDTNSNILFRTAAKALIMSGLINMKEKKRQ